MACMMDSGELSVVLRGVNSFCMSQSDLLSLQAGVFSQSHDNCLFTSLLLRMRWQDGLGRG